MLDIILYAKASPIISSLQQFLFHLKLGGEAFPRYQYLEDKMILLLLSAKAVGHNGYSSLELHQSSEEGGKRPSYTIKCFRK